MRKDSQKNVTPIGHIERKGSKRKEWVTCLISLCELMTNWDSKVYKKLIRAKKKNTKEWWVMMKGLAHKRHSEFNFIKKHILIFLYDQRKIWNIRLDFYEVKYILNNVISNQIYSTNKILEISMEIFQNKLIAISFKATFSFLVLKFQCSIYK